MVWVSIKTRYWQEPSFRLRLCSFYLFDVKVSFLCEMVMKIGRNFFFDDLMVMSLLGTMKSGELYGNSVGTIYLTSTRRVQMRYLYVISQAHNDDLCFRPVF